MGATYWTVEGQGALEAAGGQQASSPHPHLPFLKALSHRSSSAVRQTQAARVWMGARASKIFSFLFFYFCCFNVLVGGHFLVTRLFSGKFNQGGGRSYFSSKSREMTRNTVRIGPDLQQEPQVENEAVNEVQGVPRPWKQDPLAPVTTSPWSTSRVETSKQRASGRDQVPASPHTPKQPPVLKQKGTLPNVCTPHPTCWTPGPSVLPTEQTQD